MQDSADGFIEHSLQTLLGQSGALQILGSVDLLGELKTLLVGDRGQLLLGKTLNGGLVLSQIQLGSDNEDRDIGAMVVDFRVPLGLDVLEGSRGDDREARQEHVRLRVGQRSETVIILLTGGIPKTQVDGLVVNHNVGGVVVEHGGDVVTREGVSCVRNQEASLSDGTITDDDTFDGLHELCVVVLRSGRSGGGVAFIRERQTKVKPPFLFTGPLQLSVDSLGEFHYWNWKKKWFRPGVNDNYGHQYLFIPMRFPPPSQ